MSEYKCPECKDTGVYRGLTVEEPCRACGLPAGEAGGKASTVGSTEGQGLSFDPQKFAKAYIASMKPSKQRAPELHIRATEESVFDCHVETNKFVNLSGMVTVRPAGRRLELSRFLVDGDFDRFCNEVNAAYFQNHPVNLTCSFPDGSKATVLGRISFFSYLARDVTLHFEVFDA